MDSAFFDPNRGLSVQVHNLCLLWRQRGCQRRGYCFPATQVASHHRRRPMRQSTLVRCINRMHEEVWRPRSGPSLADNLNIYGAGSWIRLPCAELLAWCVSATQLLPLTMTIPRNVTAGPRPATGASKAMDHAIAPNEPLRDAGSGKDRLNALPADFPVASSNASASHE